MTRKWIRLLLSQLEVACTTLLVLATEGLSAGNARRPGRVLSDCVADVLRQRLRLLEDGHSWYSARQPENKIL